MISSRVAKVNAGNDKVEFIMCASSECKVNKNQLIPIFYSMKHASDAGWRPTDSIKYSPNGDFVYLCPECSGFMPSAIITLKSNAEMRG